MDINSLLLVMMFGAFGMGFLAYGKKAGRLIPIVAGLALMIVPYFISSILVLLLVCGALTAAPFIIRDL